MPNIHENVPLTRQGRPEEHPSIYKIEQNDGLQAWITGHPYPIRGIPTESAVQAINVVKKMLMLQPFKAMMEALHPHILHPEYMNPFAREIRKMFPSKLGLAIAMVFELDNAYRLRLQDLCDNTTKEQLLAHPIREVNRLLQINKKKDLPEVHSKFRKFGYAISIALYIPHIRKAVRDCNWNRLQTEESDRYWLSIRDDYKYKL